MASGFTALSLSTALLRRAALTHLYGSSFTNSEALTKMTAQIAPVSHRVLYGSAVTDFIDGLWEEFYN